MTAGVRKALDLDETQIGRARELARSIVLEMKGHIDAHSTTSIERTVCRLFGIDGVDDDGKPLPNVVVDEIQAGGGLDRGAAHWVCNAMLHHDLSAQQVAEEVARGTIDITRLPAGDEGAIRELASELATTACETIRARRRERDGMIGRLGLGLQPWLYIIVASGNIYEDRTQAKSAALLGADIVAVIRSTGQSLMDYVPYGPTTEGFGGTYATQENFRIIRKALDDVSEEVRRYVRLTNYSSGLCMPEIAAMGALERLDVMLSDSMYGILFRDINPKRTFVDQHFSRMLLGFGGIIINTGEDNYLTTDDAYESFHTVVASQFINEQFALLSGVPVEQMGLGHAFQINMDMEDGLLYEIAQALLVRQLFPNAPIKYMPPTRSSSGNIFRTHVLDGMFNFTSVLTGQGIHLLGMHTEAIHTPHLQDRALSLENAKYVMNTARHLGEEIVIRPGGKIQKRAQDVLVKAVEMLGQVDGMGLFTALEKGMFARVKRPRDGGKGRDGAFVKGPQYFNPFPELILGGERG
ncbi:MAG: D-lysine 5,6-aminomutase subunit alpha [Firmicutes bacterium]|nr:D-lysine 5,6-aminomutase subunit alpha [Bacillota bacterium]